MFCANCGTKQNEGEKFCPNCGTRFEEPLKIEEVIKIESFKTVNNAPEKSSTIVQSEKETSVTNAFVKEEIEDNLSIELYRESTNCIKENEHLDDVNFWNELKINYNADNSKLLQEVDLLKQSGVISDKYKFEKTVICDSKTILRKMKSEIYDELHNNGSVLRFKLYIDCNFLNGKIKFIYNGREYSLFDYDLKRAIDYFNEEVDREYCNDYYIKYDKDKNIVEGLFTKEHKGFWGFMKAAPNEEKLELRFREIYSICNKIRLL